MQTQDYSCESLSIVLSLITTLSGVGINYWQRDCKKNALLPGRAFFIVGGSVSMAVSYKRLWKLLIDRDMKKKDLCAKAGISSASITKMGKNGHVTTEILLKICTALNCRIEDIMEIVPDDKDNTGHSIPQ